MWNESNASALYIADGVTGIGSHAFSGMDTLEKVVFQDASDLTYVGSYAFSGDNKAQFTDEGNSDAGGDDPTRILDLSHVEKMGEYAFYNCDGIKGVELSGNIIAVETNEDGGTEEINHKIPNHAFESCNALKSITVPEGIETIGTAAFAGCTQASSITLPDSLVTIGDRAFMCSIDGANRSLTSLTIPENVKNIGASAFYGYKALATVTVESTKLKKPGDAAFGDNEMSAYSGPQTVGDVTVQNGGTTFKTPNAEITKLFVNYDNCYLGPISPLTLIEEESYPAMCNKAGKNVYKYTFNNEEKQLEETLDPLQPNFTETKTIPATCTRPAYYKRTCDQWFEKDKETGKWVQTTHIHNEAIPVGGEGYEEAKGHAYEVTAISNEGHITEAGGSQVTFVCKNDCHDETRDGSEKNVNLTLTLTQQEATTLQKLSDITLPALINGTLKWNEPNAELDFDEDVQYFPVTFTPDPQKYNYLQKDGNAVEASECGETQLLVGVKVEKVELDFSAIAFDNASNLILPDSDVTTPITIRNAPEEVGDPTKILYTKTGGDASSENPPVRGEKWSGTVSVTYSYNSKDYKIDENTDFEFGTEDNPYTIEVDEGTNGQGTVTISHRYEIIPGTWEDVEATAINPTYDAVDMETVHLQGVPGGATITWQYKLKGADDSTYSLAQTVEMPSDGGNSIDIAPIETAGDYTVKVQISYAGYEPENWDTTVDVHVYKKAVAIPTAVTGLTYTGEPQTGVPVAEGTDNIYTLSDNTGIDATGYTATATLTDEAFLNYCWQGRGEDQPTAEISWSIAKRSVLLPTVSQTKTYQYNGEYQKIVSAPIGTNFEYMFPAEGKDVEGKFPDSDIIAFTITNGQAKDVGEYPIKATLTNGNYQWVGTGAPDDGSLSVDLGEWEITPIYLTAPAFTANGKEYDGQSYAPDTLVQWQDESRAQAVAKVQEKMKGRDQFTFSHFVYNPGGATAPKDAGNYTIQAVYTYPTQNYVLQNNTSRNFIITQKSLTMQAPENQNLTYTGASHEIQGVTVKAEGLVEGDYEDAYIITYSSQEWDKTLNDGKGGWSSSTTTYEGLPSLEHVGRYLITAKLTSKNYTAADVTYQVEISIATQTVELTGEGLQGDGSAEDPYTISKTLGNEPFTVTGKGYVGENATNAAITYESSDSDTASVDGNGQVTLKKATAKGESVTITVTAAGSANYQAATATYTITVDKGTPQVTVKMPTGGSADHTYSYTGKALTFDATVTGASNGAIAPTTDRRVTYNFYSDNSGQKGEALANQPTGIGTYWVEAVYKGDDNYNPEISAPVKFTISPAALEVEATGHDAIYDGDEHDPASITVTGVGGTSFEEDDYTVSYIEKSSEGEAEPAIDDGRWDSTLQVKDVADSGDYWIKVEIKNDDSYDPYINSVNVDIDPRQLTVTKKVIPTKVYDGTVDATKNVTFQSINTGVDGEKINVTGTHAEYNSAEVGASSITITYTLEAVGTTALANYTVSTDGGEITDDGLGTETVKVVDGTPVGIDPAPITVAISNQSSVYDGSAPTVSNVKDTDWKVTAGKIYHLVPDTEDNLGITLSIASDSDAKDADTYAITGKWTNKNYAVTFTGSWKGEDANNGEAGIYTITPRPISVQIGNAEGFYGDAPVKPSGLLKDISTEDGEGLVKGDSLDQFLNHVVINASPNTDVGSHYTITGTSGEYGNYNVTFASGTYTVKQRPITITIKDHSSVYGEEIDGGITTPLSGTDYTVAITNQATTGDAIVKGDNLEIKLTTEATADSPVDDYDITGSAAGEKVNNYAITWAGNGGDRDDGGKNGKYTIKPAQLEIAFTQGNQVTNGVSINITDSYKDNPLVLKNASTDAEVSEADKSTLGITYSIGTAGGGTGDVSQIAEIDRKTGEVTIHSTGTVRVTATVTAKGDSNCNYTGAQTTWYELNIISGGQMTLNVTPETGLAYTGEPQELIEKPICSLDSAEIHYSLDNQKWEETIPTGTNAGNYTVYVKATDPSGQYSDVTEHVMVTIDKATLEGSFAQKEYTHVLTTGNSYDSATVNPLTITSQNYTGNADAYTYRSDNMDVAIAVNGGRTIRVLGSAGQSAEITVTVPGDDNYNGKTFTYKLEISDDLSKIVYSVGNQEVTYNGQPQTIEVKVTQPASGATVMYQDEDGNYTLSEPPAYTDVKDGGTTIKFQITAPGYETVEGTATLTINPRDISLCQVEGIAASYTFVNKPIEPQTVEVVDGSVILKEDTDYTITYGANKEVGESESEDLTNGGGYVKITGTGNYTGEVTKYFAIKAVDASDLTASLNRTFGYYGDSNTNNATVTVTHGSHTVTSDGSNTVSIAVKDNTGADVTNQSDVVSINDQTVTFNQVGTYTIEVTVTGNHETNAPIQLTYALLPVEKGKLVLKADNETSVVETYGDTVNGTITVTDVNGTPMTENTDYTLAYTYTPFEGTAQGSKPYDPSVMSGTPAAGMYVVTATGQGGYANSVGTFTFLILQRDLAKATLAVNDTDLVFNHDEKKPDVTVTVDGNAQPTKDTDYTITYYNNVNASNAAKAVVTATGNNFTGSKTADFTIAPKPITGCVVENIPDQYYTGNEVIPPVTIKDSSYTLSYTLILGYDYTTACADKGPGAATVTITGTGNYTETTTEDFVIKSEGAPEPSERFDLAVTPNQWIWKDDLTNLRLSVTFGTGNELTLGTEYTLSINNEVYGDAAGETKEQAIEAIKNLKPGKYTITATGVGAYNGSNDAETVTIQKIQPEVTVTATPNSLSGGGKVTLTLKGEKLPAFAEGQDLSSLLTASAKDEKNAPDLSELEWETDEQTGVMTAELTLPNTSETYTFTLTFTGNEYYEAATASEQVVVAQQIISGGGGGPVEDQPANPDDTGVSDWLNTKEHLAYLAGYPGGTFGPDQNMTRAEAAQMFYNLLLDGDHRGV